MKRYVIHVNNKWVFAEVPYTTIRNLPFNRTWCMHPRSYSYKIMKIAWSNICVNDTRKRPIINTLHYYDVETDVYSAQGKLNHYTDWLADLQVFQHEKTFRRQTTIIFIMIYGTQACLSLVGVVAPDMGLLPNTQKCGLRMRLECRERFPRHRGLAIPACITARAWRTCRDACRDR